MRLVQCPRLITAALIGAAAICVANAGSRTASAATPNPDGIYAVDISTQQGSCDKDYHWMILISGGRVSSAGDTPVEASGQINPRGSVALEFQRFGQVAKATGRLGSGAGSGTWSSPTMQCAGSWRATRRS